jgi:histidyl-tRNA synthetase
VTERIQAIRGMNDLLPNDTIRWQKIEQIFAQSMRKYGYQEIRFPILESTALFKRTIGTVTDIVEKEMYTFTDLNQESLSMRPEGTAGCLRACLEHGLLHNQQQKLWYNGPMFRHEKPQKGRYRQFHQLGIEALGFSGVGIELELILICQQLWKRLGIDNIVQLQINTLGTIEERQVYRQKLIDYFSAHHASLDEECQRRLHRSPMRILDSKNPALRDVIEGAPKLIECLSDESRQHFIDLQAGLQALDIPFQINPTLVRGLDYYGHSVFEWVTDRLGAQATVCAGGRYDLLVEQLGGQATPAVGLALGIERLLLLIETIGIESTTESSDIFIITDNAQGQIQALALAEQLRAAADWSILVYLGQSRMKAQFKQADRVGARFALILGEQELQNGTVSLKDLREGTQKSMPKPMLIEELKSALHS